MFRNGAIVLENRVIDCGFVRVAGDHITAVGAESESPHGSDHVVDLPLQSGERRPDPGLLVEHVNLDLVPVHG